MNHPFTIENCTFRPFITLQRCAYLHISKIRNQLETTGYLQVKSESKNDLYYFDIIFCDQSGFFLVSSIFLISIETL